MLLADFFARRCRLPFVFVPIPQARIISGVVTLALLVVLGIGRARIAKRSIVRTVAETVSIGIAAALAGVIIGVLIDHGFRHKTNRRTTKARATGFRAAPIRPEAR